MRTAERDLFVVRRPYRTPDRIDGRQIDARRHSCPGDIHQVHHVLAIPLRCKRDHPAVVRKRALRIEKSKLLEIRIEGAFNESLDALAGARVSQPEIDEQLAALEAAIRQERNAITVGGERRCEEDLASASLLGEQRLGECAWPVENCGLRKVIRANRLPTFVPQLM